MGACRFAVVLRQVRRPRPCAALRLNQIQDKAGSIPAGHQAGLMA